MTTLLLILGMLAVIGGAAYVAIKLGGTKEKSSQYYDTIKSIEEKKDKDHEVNRLNDNALLKRWLKLVRKQSN